MPIETAGRLPFLVEYGGWIGPLLLVLVTFLLVVAARKVYRASVQALIRREARSDEARRAPLASGEVVLRGILRGQLETATAWLNVDGTRVDLAAITVRHEGSVCGVVDGDVVVVIGTASMRHEITSSATLWEVSGEIAALCPVMRSHAIGPRVVPLVVALGLSCYLALGAYGRYLTDEAISEGDNARYSGRVGELDRLAIAAALPGARTRALEQLEFYLRARAGKTEDVLAQAAALSRLTHACAPAAFVLLHAGAYESVLHETETCPRAEWRTRALVHLGRYEDAVRDASFRNASIYEQLTALIALRRWTDAATMLDGLVSDDAVLSMRLRCFAILIRHYGGERTTSIDASNATCDLVRSVVPVLDRARLTDAIRARPIEAVAHAWNHRSVIAWAYGVRAEVAPALYGLTSASSDSTPAWFVPYVDESHDPAQVRAWLAVLHVLRGDFDKARVEAGRYADVAEPVTEPRYNGTRGFIGAVQVRAGDTKIESTSHVAVDEMLGFREGYGGRRGDGLLVSEVECTDDAERAMRRAAAGDGVPLLRILEECRVSPSAYAPLLAVAPRIQTKRADLARTVRAVIPPGFDRTPFEIVQRLSFSRDLARALGATDDVARLQGIIDRHLDAFATREQVVALALLSDLVP